MINSRAVHFHPPVPEIKRKLINLFRDHPDQEKTLDELASLFLPSAPARRIDISNTKTRIQGYLRALKQADYIEARHIVVAGSTATICLYRLKGAAVTDRVVLPKIKLSTEHRHYARELLSLAEKTGMPVTPAQIFGVCGPDLSRHRYSDQRKDGMVKASSRRFKTFAEKHLTTVKVNGKTAGYLGNRQLYDLYFRDQYHYLEPETAAANFITALKAYFNDLAGNSPASIATGLSLSSDTARALHAMLKQGQELKVSIESLS